MPKSLRTLYRKLFEEKSTRNKFQQKPLPKKYWQNISTTNPWREISTKQFSKETPPKKIFDEKIYQKKVYQKIFEHKIRPKYVWRKICRKKGFKKLWRKEFSNISLKKLFWELFFGETIPPNSHQSTPQQIPEDPWKLFAESLDKSFFAGKFRSETFKTQNLITVL